ncbi:hypothetical protein CONCODRAFT_18387 [Conidiobolus coronatus NRRL 28638]|uniref:Uncharacterized protein n=1 Tax=Conidiobolus coronatus (strain ATCC 28846 / CBS 209.66 / NRRL 28638) TaxID=796925 RepID=A0A137P2T9_CONC2|nr:hypothetical protein CONCODRAFT_18387 [Conidiobolus coronatus NRRL 28638]|eukprot:KXN69336.1 hypothetical protein CONCODRAFT_18387 [Conidiobolus coronatus NRRL 28638]
MLKNLILLTTGVLAITDTFSFDVKSYDLKKCKNDAKLKAKGIPEVRYIFMFDPKATKAQKDKFGKEVLCSGALRVEDLSIINGFAATVSEAFMDAGVFRLNAPYSDILQSIEKDQVIRLDDPIEMMGTGETKGRQGLMGLDF